MKSATAPDRSKVSRYMGHLKDHGPDELNEQQFKFEHRSKSENSSAVWAFKAHQLRVYGGWLDWGGKRFFICPDAVKKKRDKANMDLLKVVSRKLGELQCR